jgi:hypothetical protein
MRGDLVKNNFMITMSAKLKATFRCMKQLWERPNAKSGLIFFGSYIDTIEAID